MKRINTLPYACLWDKLKKYALRVGRSTTRPALLLFFVLTDSKVPAEDRTLIISALAYLLFPIDLISAKKIPIIGLIDDFVSLYIAYDKVKKYITPDIEWKVDTLLDQWFVQYEIVTD